MNTRHVDVAVIGGGSAGMVSYRQARAKTKSVVLIEGHQFGTTCARVGCMPSKLLIAAAETMHQIKKAPGFGIFPQGETKIDGEKVMQRIQTERNRFVGGVLKTIDKIPEENKISGYAKFIDDHTLQIGELTLTADRIVIATGSHTAIPSTWPELGDRLLTNDEIFELPTLPKRIAVFGAGVIGLELGQALHRLGSEVIIFGSRGHIKPLTHPEIIECADKIFNEEFPLDIHPKVESIERKAESVEISYFNKEDRLETIKVDYVLAATGRRPNVDKIDIQNTSIELNERGVPVVNPLTMQTSVPHIFIAGDASNELLLLHEAADQGRIAGSNAGNYPDIKDGLRHHQLSIAFCDPNIAIVGNNYSTLVEQYGEEGFVTGQLDFTNQGRARVMLRNKGMIHIYAEQGTGLFLGAEMIIPDGEHIAHLLAWCREQNMTVQQMLNMPVYHPVIEEGVRTAIQGARAKIHR